MLEAAQKRLVEHTNKIFLARIDEKNYYAKTYNFNLKNNDRRKNMAMSPSPDKLYYDHFYSLSSNSAVHYRKTIYNNNYY